MSIIPLLFFVVFLFLLLYTFCINTLPSYFTNKITDIPIIIAPIIINPIVLFVSPVSGNISFNSFSAVSFISLFSPVTSTSMLFFNNSYPLGAFVSVTLYFPTSNPSNKTFPSSPVVCSSMIICAIYISFII